MIGLTAAPNGVEVADYDADGKAYIAVSFLSGNKIEVYSRKLLAALGLTERFALILGGDTLGPGRAKPAPDMIGTETKERVLVSSNTCLL